MRRFLLFFAGCALVIGVMAAPVGNVWAMGTPKYETVLTPGWNPTARADGKLVILASSPTLWSYTVTASGLPPNLAFILSWQSGAHQVLCTLGTAMSDSRGKVKTTFNASAGLLTPGTAVFFDGASGSIDFGSPASWNYGNFTW